MKQKKLTPLLVFAVFLMPVLSFAQSEPAVELPLPGPNPYVQNFFIPPTQQLDQKITEVRGFPIIKTHSRSQNAEYSVVTDFGGGALKTRYLPGLKDVKDIDEYIKKNLQIATFEGVEIRKLSIPVQDGEMAELFWVGNKAFPSSQEAMAEITRIKNLVQSQGGNFSKAISEAPIFIEPEPEMPAKTQAQFQKEEDLILRFTDQMSIGEKLFGPFQGVPAGEPILWQSFGETSWRMTNLAEKHYDTQVGYWTNRLVFKGIRFPLNTIDPYVEVTGSMDTSSTTWTNNLMFFAGLEWRPLQRNPWLANFRPFGWGIPLLEWMRNYRVYIKYGDRKNIKGEITNSHDFDLIWGVQCYYEFGTDLPSMDEGKPKVFADYLRQYVWGEYYGDYYVSKTGFTSEKHFDAIIANSTITLGIKLPAIPLPQNPINDELVLMPYFRFEHVNNGEFGFWYQNQCFLATGIRWMPFRAYKWKNNEWLSKTKVFAEWVGPLRAHRTKDEAPSGTPTYDLRFGVSFSQRRF